MEIGILGAGAFGSALATHLANRGHRITLWCRTEADAARMREARESPYLPGVTLGAHIVPTHDLATAIVKKPMVVAVTPSQVIRALMTDVARFVDADTIIVNGSKGLEEGTLATIDAIYRDVLPGEVARRAAFLSGPTFAKELARGLPTAIVVASLAPESGLAVQSQFATERLRVYTSDDVLGIELGGALKNVYAIGAGISDGLGFGNNARAAFITRSLSEMIRLGVRLGANPMTFSGLAGLGDLVLTCTGDLSRNRQVGLELGKGRAIDAILAGLNAVAEGVKTARAAYALSERLGVDMPNATATYQVLYEGKEPQAAVAELMRRDLKPELG